MCGRYQSRYVKQRLAEEFHLRNLEELTTELAPNYNVAPTTMQPVIVEDRDTGDRVMRMMRWGLIPAWAKSPKDSGISTVNTKAETIMEKLMWRQPFKKRRCIIPADGYYEWEKIDPKTKQPWMYTLKSGRMMGLAGIWEHWKASDGKLEMNTFSIITTDPNRLAESVHNRMPVILQPEDYERWLKRDDSLLPPIDLLRPYDAEDMEACKVNSRVGNVRNNDPDLIAPINTVN